MREKVGARRSCWFFCLHVYLLTYSLRSDLFVFVRLCIAVEVSEDDTKFDG